MEPIAVLVVDDSVVVRRIVTSILSEDPGIRVVGTAASGRSALEMIERLAPDILTLDIEMPDMDGLETLRHLRRLHPRLPVIMFSTLTERAAAATLEAISLGARDYVTKPGNVGSASAAFETVRSQLLPKIKALVPSAAPTPAPAPTARPAPVGAWRERSDPHGILAIGSSTGGPDALATIVRELPADLPVPVVIVQHMPPIFTRLLAQRLDKVSKLTVVEGRPDMRLEPGLVVVAPGDFHLLVVEERGVRWVATNQEARQSGCRPSVDVFFRSAASVFGARVLACVLTGMGQDGLRGCERLRAGGAEIVVQDEPTSVVWGMPGAIATAGLADRILPLPAIAADLTDALRRARDWAPPNSPLGAGATP
ncbi:MAG TPA: chemotaxis-specific protein-glutamate methyltransferase CheB [Actinomycetes bacterium]|nr:chemotaxis-specific protein-glutamate methyltransferase CheB [Actinomycetes bacterium]